MVEIFHNKGFALFFKRDISSDQLVSVPGTLCEDLYSAVFQFANHERVIHFHLGLVSQMHFTELSEVLGIYHRSFQDQKKICDYY